MYVEHTFCIVSPTLCTIRSLVFIACGGGFCASVVYFMNCQSVFPIKAMIVQIGFYENSSVPCLERYFFFVLRWNEYFLSFLVSPLYNAGLDNVFWPRISRFY